MRGIQSLLEQELVDHTCKMDMEVWPLPPGATAVGRTTDTTIMDVLRVLSLPWRKNPMVSCREHLTPSGLGKGFPWWFCPH